MTALEIQPRPTVSYPLIPLPTLQYASLCDCMWLWERVRRENGSQSSIEAIDCTERLYVPVEEDAGCHLQVTCTPASSTAAGQRTGESVRVTTGAHLPSKLPAATALHDDVTSCSGLCFAAPLCIVPCTVATYPQAAVAICYSFVAR